jgi:lipopolysaccharide assembly outer membrane protein LptD (OstA)
VSARLVWLARVALALGVLGAAPPARAQAPEPPLEIRADNMTGSHGPEGDIILLNGHLRATRARSVLTADAGRYLRTEGLLFLEGHVVMVDSSTTITCDQAVFSELDDRLDVNGNVVIRDKDSELRAPAGVYDRRTGRAELTGRVIGRDRDQRLDSDRAVYWRDSSLVQARGRVVGTDEANRLRLDADSVDFDRRSREALATGHPVLTSRDEQGHATLLRARVLRVNTESRLAQALDSVLVESDTLRARADRALFDDRADRGWLFGNPRVWDDQTVVTGDTLEIRSRKRVLERVVVLGNAAMDYRGARPNTQGELSRLTGRRVDVFFTDRDIDSLIAVGDARNEYGAPAKSGKTQESNLALGDTITVFFKARKIDRARVQGKAKGEFHSAVDVADTTAQKREVVVYDAVRIEYEVPRSRIVLDQGAHLTYGDLELRSKRVEFDVERQTLVAEGKPQLKDRGDQVEGHLMTYDLESRVGNIYDAQTEYERGLYHGERIRKAGADVLDVMGGAYSTCDLRQPHYHFASRYMKIYLKDKLVAKPVVFYLKRVPVLALPFWVFPIKPGRHSGFLFPQMEFGFNNAAGQFVRNAGYYWAPNDYMDLTVSGDYYQAEPSWVLRAESQYKLLYVLDGSMRSSFARNENTKRDDWDFYGTHSQELTPRTRLMASGSFVSSRDYSSSNLYGASLSQRVNRFLTSNLALTHNADWASFGAYVDRRQDLDADAALQTKDLLTGRLPTVGTAASLANLTETRPSLSVSFPTRTLGSLALFKGTGFEKGLRTVYSTFSSRYVEQREQRAYVRERSYAGTDSSNVLGQRVKTRRAAAFDASLSDSRRVLGWLNVAPRFNTNAVVWDHDRLGHTFVPAAVWNAGVSSGTTYYGTFAPRLGRLIGLRHVVSPNVSFSFAPESKGLTYVDSLGVRRNRFESFGGIGLSGFRSATMSFSLDQRLQVKLQRGTEVTRLDNLLSWTTSGSYNFLWREQGATHPLSQLGSNISLQPPGVMSASLGWTTDVYEKQPVRTLSSYVGVNLGSGMGKKRRADPELPMEQGRAAEAADPDAFRDNWTLGLAYSYAGGYVGEQWADRQSANAVAHYQFSPGWAVDWSASYDITYHALTTQRFSLQRDLHCWTASFSRTFAVGGEAEYYFRLGIKEQKEIYFERGTRVGSIGGIQ